MRKQIKDYEGLYDIDAEGNVYSLPKLTHTPTTTFYTKERILKPFSNKKGYLLVTLAKKFNVNVATIKQIIVGKSYRNIK